MPLHVQSYMRGWHKITSTPCPSMASEQEHQQPRVGQMCTRMGCTAHIDFRPTCACPLCVSTPKKCMQSGWLSFASGQFLNPCRLPAVSHTWQAPFHRTLRAARAVRVVQGETRSWMSCPRWCRAWRRIGKRTSRWSASCSSHRSSTRRLGIVATGCAQGSWSMAGSCTSHASVATRANGSTRRPCSCSATSPPTPQTSRQRSSRWAALSS